MFWPLFVALGVMALAYLLYRMLPEVVDHGSIFLWIIAAFLVVYVGAAFYLGRYLPKFDQPTKTATQENIDVVRTPDRL